MFILVDCGDPGTPDNGSRNLTDTLEGSNVTYSCDSGFELIGNRTQTCELTPNGTFWSSERPRCICKYGYCNAHKEMHTFKIVVAVICGDPGTPGNGSTSVISDTVGSVANHTCNEGFTLEGASERMCLQNGSWSDSLPTCVSKY